MACSNCYNGCAEIVSDQCVKYTGIDIPALDIKKGDSLSWVEQALISFLRGALDGTGIKIALAEEDYCTVVTQYLSQCSTVTALDLFKALVKAVCSLQEQINNVDEIVTELEGGYEVDCLSGVDSASGTHDVVEAIIVKLCSIDSTLTALALDISTNYVKLADLNDLIAEYIAGTASATRYKTRMVPYAIQPYVGSLSNFDATGKGQINTEWEDIYLCNGQNSTPDLRGRTIVGAIAGVPGGILSPDVDPASSSFNPNYSISSPIGANSITLTEAQIPSHTHTASTNGSHSHTVTATAEDATGVGALVGGADDSVEDGQTTTSTEGSHTHTIGSTGGGQAHSNIQPVFPTYYIMYIP